MLPVLDVHTYVGGVSCEHVGIVERCGKRRRMAGDA